MTTEELINANPALNGITTNAGRSLVADLQAELARLRDERGDGWRPMTPGPWNYRPYEHDDWGLIRSADGTSVPPAPTGITLDAADGK